MNSRIGEALQGCAEAIHTLQRARGRLIRELAAADSEVARGERRLKIALRGMTLARWQAVVSERTAITTAAASREAHLAKKRRIAVEAALAQVRAADNSRAFRVARAERDLEEAQRNVARFGPLALRLAGAVTVSSDRLRDGLGAIKGNAPDSRRPPP